MGCCWVVFYLRRRSGMTRQVSDLVLMKLPAVYGPEWQLAYMKLLINTNMDWVNQRAKNVKTECQERIRSLPNVMVIFT